jgi:hypothetical protein
MAVTLNANSSTGFIATSDTSGVLQLQTGGTTAVTVDASQNVTLAGTLTATGVTTVPAGTVSAPAITTTGDTNTGIFFPAADTIAFSEGGVESMRIDASGNVGIGTTPSAWGSGIKAIQVGANSYGSVVDFNNGLTSFTSNLYYTGSAYASMSASSRWSMGYYQDTTNGAHTWVTSSAAGTNSSTPTINERMRLDSSGNLLVGKTSSDDSAGCSLSASGVAYFVRSDGAPLLVNRLTTDGTLVAFYQATVLEGNISVSGTTVSYNGGHLSRWAQTITAKDDTLVKGTVLSNLDEMNVYTDSEGNPVPNEQLNKVKVSDTEGDANVAGVFVNWTHDEDHNVDEINMAMTGDMIIRIAQGVTVQRGDLLMSAGNGTAKPQGDDIVRSKTIAKVTSTHVTCTYADGSFCVPCVLMAC